MYSPSLMNVRKNLMVVLLFGLFIHTVSADPYTFTFSGQLTQVIDNHGKLAGTDILPGAPFTGYFTYETSATPWFEPFTGVAIYQWVKAYRFTVTTAQGNFEFGYIDSSAAFFQVDVRSYDKLWWGQSGINGTVALTPFPSELGTYMVGFNLTNNAGDIWSVANPLPDSLHPCGFDFNEVSFGGYYTSNSIDYRIVGHLDESPVPAPDNNGPLCINDTLRLTTDFISGATYEWAGPDNFSSTLQNPEITGVSLAKAGIYTVTATTILGCESASTTVVINNPTPVITGDLAYCPQGSSILDAGNYATYLWSSGGETSKTISVNTTGMYSVNVTDVIGCAGSSVPVSVTIEIIRSDFDINGVVNTNDYLLMVGQFGQACVCPEDLNQDGVVNTMDYLILLQDFNRVCQ